MSIDRPQFKLRAKQEGHVYRSEEAYIIITQRMPIRDCNEGGQVWEVSVINTLRGQTVWRCLYLSEHDGVIEAERVATSMTFA
jgi:hypothetical protein